MSSFMFPHHQMLGLNELASIDEIKTAFRKLAKTYHPDLNPDDAEAAKKFSDINQSYRALLADFDCEQKKHHVSNVDLDLNEALNPFFKSTQDVDRTATFHSNTPVNGKDIPLECNISLSQAYNGTVLDINHPFEDDTITIRVPKGIKDGSKMKVKGRGRYGLFGGSNGDIVISVKVQSDNRFSIQNGYLKLEKDIPFTTALLGGDVHIKHLDGKIISVNTPSFNTPTKDVFIENYGWPKLNSNQSGKLLLRLKMTFPDKLSEKQKHLLRELSDDFR